MHYRGSVLSLKATVVVCCAGRHTVSKLVALNNLQVSAQPSSITELTSLAQ